MKSHTRPNRILALDLRPRRFGFAVLEGARHLLDWGIRNYPRGNHDPSAMKKRILPSLRMFSPSTIVIKAQGLIPDPSHPLMNKFLDVLKTAAARESLEISGVGFEEIRSFLESLGVTTKYQASAHIAVFFPELTWKVPPARKPWQTEPHNQTIFDAITIGLAYFARFEEITSICKQSTRS